MVVASVVVEWQVVFLIGWRMLLSSGWLRLADPEGPLQVQSEVPQFYSHAWLALRSTRLWCAGSGSPARSVACLRRLQSVQYLQTFSFSAVGQHSLLGQHFDILVVQASAPLHSSCAGNLK